MYKISNQTLFIGKNVFNLKKYPSSNQFLKELTQKTDLNEGTVVNVLHQTKGVGQRGNQWITDANQNITSSILLKPVFMPIKMQFSLTIAISLAVCNTLSQVLPYKVWIKWPNDIYVKQQKIAGILIENIISHKAIKASIIGLGINVNQTKFECPHAVSIQNITGQPFDQQPIFEILFKTLEHYYVLLKNGNYQTLWEQYYNVLLGYQTEKIYRLPDEPEKHFSGVINQVKASGVLCLSVDNTIKEFSFQEIKMVH